MKEIPSEATVRMVELATEVGGSVEAAREWVHRVGAEVALDWSGRPAVPASVATAVVRAYGEFLAHRAELGAAYVDYLNGWRNDLRRVGQEAFDAVYQGVLSRMRGRHTDRGGNAKSIIAPDVYTRDKANRAAQDAQEKWRKKNPPLTELEFAKKTGRPVRADDFAARIHPRVELR